MIFKKNLVLIGMMGAGKSTIGTILAEKLKFKFIDTDYEIEKNERNTIKKIFDHRGEKYFRDVEEKIVLEKLKSNNCVVALGGGSFLNPKIRKNILENNLSFWLDWDNKILIDRIFKSKKRPKVENLSKKEIERLKKKRDDIYKFADYKLNCTNFTKNQITNKIIDFYENKKNKN